MHATPLLKRACYETWHACCCQIPNPTCNCAGEALRRCSYRQPSSFSFFVKSSIFNIEMISLHAGCLLLVVGTAQALSPTEPPPPPPPSVSDYNVVFDVPSDNGTYQHCFALIVSTNFTLNLFMHCTCSLKPSY